ncbi:MAG TPA: family 10 glycosylhydrolase [Vicinamibacterales bacterium]|jgi:uncharacterized lipoprotein YddW (UPF0748 family)|nr:family 10 glycosylhydrolase [Vicinamibacterales bacterium]
MFSAVVRNTIATHVAAVAVLCACASPAASPGPPEGDVGDVGDVRDVEVRALWVVRTSLTSPAAIAAMVSSARAGSFNTLLVQVRGRGDAYYEGGVEPRPTTLSSQPSFDPLATAIARGHDAGLRVHAWININLVAGADLPSARGHVVRRHPEWVMVPRAIAGDLSRLDPHRPEFLARLAQYVHDRPGEAEGLYLSPVNPAAADYTVAIVRDIAERYGVDGIHLDYIRYPDEDFDYGRETVAAFRASLVRDLGPSERGRYDARRATDPLIYPRAFPERWREFRADRLTALVARLRAVVKRARPSAVLSAAVAPDADAAATHRLQDWRAWTAANLVDVVCPMAYTTDASVFAAQVAAAGHVAGSHPVWAGIGAYRLSRAQIVDDVQTARRLGAGGIVLFSYDSLADPSRGPDFLARVGRAAFSSR